MTDAFLTSLRYTLMVTVPLTVGLVVLARPLTLAIFGDQWHRSIPALQVLTLYACAVTVGIPAGTAYKSLGRLNVLIALAIPRAALAVASIWIFVGDGIVAVAACQAGVAALFAVIGISLAARLLAAGPGRIARAAWPALTGGAVTAGVLVAVAWTVESSVLTLLIGLPLGTLAYLATLWLVAADSLRELWAMAFPGRARTVASPANPRS
jgi:O-antigen/teichoic acid export membrane protein